jgi:hypothetical protein
MWKKSNHCAADLLPQGGERAGQKTPCRGAGLLACVGAMAMVALAGTASDRTLLFLFVFR